MSTATFSGANSSFTTTLARRAALDLACFAERGTEGDLESLCYDDLRMLAKGRGGTLSDGIKRLANALRREELGLAQGEYRLAGIALRSIEARLTRGDRIATPRPE